MNKKNFMKLFIGVIIFSVLLTSMLLFVLILNEYRLLNKRYHSLFLEYSVMEQEVEDTINTLNDKLNAIEDSITRYENKKESLETTISNSFFDLKTCFIDINKKVTNVDELIYKAYAN